MKPIIAIEGLEVIYKKDSAKCKIKNINPDSYWLHREISQVVKNGWDGASANITDIEGVNGELIYHPNFIGSEVIEKDSHILVSAGSDVHNQILEIFNRIKQVNIEAVKLRDEIGGNGHYKNSNALAGGIGAIQFNNGKPSKDWIQFGTKSKYPNVYCHKDDKSELSEKIKSLPLVQNEDMNKIYGFPTRQHVSNYVVFKPGIEKVGDDYILDVTGGCVIAIKEGMRIISKAEYYTLKGE